MRLLDYLRHHFVLVAGLAYLVLASVMTFPFVIRPTTTVLAPLDGDEGYSIIKYEAIKREGLNPFISDKIHSIAAPDGIATNVGVDRVSFFSTLFLWLGTLFVGAVTTHALQAFLGYFLTGFITFLFLRRVTMSAPIAFIGGFIYAYCPLMVPLAISDPTYMHMWLYILPIWALWEVYINGATRTRLMLAALSIVPAMFWTPYYAFHILLVGLSCLAGIAWLFGKRNDYANAVKVVLTCLSSWIGVSIMYYLIGMSGGSASVPVRSTAEVYSQSAHPLMYIFPGMYSAWGHTLYEHLVRIVPRAGYTDIYLGITCIILATISVYGLMRMKVNDRLRAAIILGLLVCITTFAFSLAPTVSVFGLRVPTPNILVAKIEPALRAGQRLAMPLMGGVAILAGAGIYLATRRLDTRMYYLVLALISVLIALDFSTVPPSLPRQIQMHGALVALSNRPAALTAQYNYSSLVSNPGQEICFAQFQHKMPIVNDCAMSRNPYDFDKPTPTLAKIIQAEPCRQLVILKQLGAKYLILTFVDQPIFRCLASKDTTPILQDDTYKIYRLD